MVVTQLIITYGWRIATAAIAMRHSDMVTVTSTTYHVSRRKGTILHHL
jgi:hypothetical protein